MLVLSPGCSVKLGVLVECDPSIKAIISRINEQHNHDFIIEDIDDEHVLVKGNRHEDLKRLLKEVRCRRSQPWELGIQMKRQTLKDSIKEPEESSESD
jgi:TFIIH basal transcription factor complex TTD-A subunit